jgi:hypothetical protein
VFKQLCKYIMLKYICLQNISCKKWTIASMHIITSFSHVLFIVIVGIMHSNKFFSQELPFFHPHKQQQSLLVQASWDRLEIKSHESKKHE